MTPPNMPPQSASSDPLLRRSIRPHGLAGLRMLLEDQAAWAGLTQPRCGEFVLAVDALISTVFEQGGGDATVVLYQSGADLECHINGVDLGDGGLPHFLAGPEDVGGKSLWLAQMLTDRLTITTGTAGTQLTVMMRLPPPTNGYSPGGRSPNGPTPTEATSET